MKRSGLRFEFFILKMVKNRRGEKKCLLFFFNLFTFEVLFKRLFAPTFQTRMYKIFRDSESWRKSNGKKLSQM